MLAGGVAYRFFFWMLAVSLVGNGALGFIDAQDIQDVLTQQGVDASIVEHDPDQPTVRLGSVVAGDRGRLAGAVDGLPGREGTDARARHGLGRARPARAERADGVLVFTGTCLVLVVSMSAVRWVREESPTPGLIATFAVVVVPFTIWLLASRYLPHEDVGWMGLLPGAVLVAVGLEGLHLFTVYFLGPKLANATELYGVLGVVSTILFWLYIAGRLVVGAATVNASLYEQSSQSGPPLTRQG